MQVETQHEEELDAVQRRRYGLSPRAPLQAAEVRETVAVRQVRALADEHIAMLETLRTDDSLSDDEAEAIYEEQHLKLGGRLAGIVANAPRDAAAHSLVNAWVARLQSPLRRLQAVAANISRAMRRVVRPVRALARPREARRSRRRGRSRGSPSRPRPDEPSHRPLIPVGVLP